MTREHPPLGLRFLIMMATLFVATHVCRAQVYEKIFSFTDAIAADTEGARNKGEYPQGALILGVDGNFYGTTRQGGRNRQGTIFRISPFGVMTVLVEFAGGFNGESVNRGQYPTPMTQGNDGNFYGITSGGGTSNRGTIFRMSPAGQLKTLVEFGILQPGGFLSGSETAGLVLARDGNFYGVDSGSSNAHGSIYRLNPSGEVTVLVNFTGSGGANRGMNPRGTLIEGADGDLYGTTENGGIYTLGTVFRMSLSGELTTLIDFTGSQPNNKGARPQCRLMQGRDGNFYGTTSHGGTDDKGTVFKMTASGMLTTLVEFADSGSLNRGRDPRAGLVEGADGSLFGSTAFGGNSGFGTLFRVTKGGNLTTLFDFNYLNGALPSAEMTLGSDGSFYGTTGFGGTGASGILFKLAPSGNLTRLIDFSANGSTAIGSSPQAELISATNGKLYGTTLNGARSAEGTIFEIGSTGTPQTVLEFGKLGYILDRGKNPSAALLQGSDGNYYGTTQSGGEFSFSGGSGTVFRMTPTGNVSTLASFPGPGSRAALVEGANGTFYGTTSGGGISNNGTIFKITSAGELSTLVKFTGNGISESGSEPLSSLVKGKAPDQDFYGTTSAGGTHGYGTAFKMTPAGELTLLAHFNYYGAAHRGIHPRGALVQGDDGNFYGTTSYGGATGHGTIFRLTTGGVISTVIDFTDNGMTNKGATPQAGLMIGPDGNFYGTTSKGGAGAGGTVFRLSPAGVFTTLVEFGTDEDHSPKGRLTTGPDGNLYGTCAYPGGSVFRFLFPGPSLIAIVEPAPDGQNAHIVASKVTVRGQTTEVFLDFGTSQENLNQTISVGASLNGFRTNLIGTKLVNLSPATVYYYRFRAVSDEGTTSAPIQSFFTLAEPAVTIHPASGITPTSAIFNAAVNANLYRTEVVFEWSTDANFSASTLVPSNPGTISGNMPESVSAAVAGLKKGTTYFYRVVATNAADTVVSGTQSFTTLTEPTATVSAPTAITSQSAILNGSVNSKGTSTAVIFEYGTDGSTFPFSVGATPSTVTGETNTAVSASLFGLTQGATYHYRIRATSAGGVGVSGSALMALDILSGFTRVVPAAPPEAQGFVLVTLTPSGIGGWRFTGEQQWRASGVPAGGLTTGDRNIEFRPMPGYIQPPLETVSVVSGGAATLIDRVYFETPASGSGGISVSLKPDAIAAPGVPQAERAQWRLLGGDDTQWRDSDATLSGLLPGNYLIECKPVAGRTTPPTSAVLVQDFQTAVPTLTYFLAGAVNGTPPGPIPFETVNADTTLPYAHVGQIRSNVGSSSGFVVKQRVVATAGHVVFDDGTLSAVTGLQWLFQRHRGTHEPKPQEPRGFYIFDGYASQRAIENTPGSSSPLSQNLDVAALYFLEDAGRAGYGGFLASDGIDNEFLLSPAQKLLVGYPVDGISANDRGRMHATPPANVAFTRAFGRTYTTPDIRSSGGMSGGPLCVQFNGGNYYPAAIYLGGSGQTVVRSIDSQVIELFTRAEVSGNGGGNNTGGGITHTNVTVFGSPGEPGAIRVHIEPAAAREAGALWGLTPESPARPSGGQRTGLNAGSYLLDFKPIEGFLPPVRQSVQVTGGQQSQITFTYVPGSGALEAWRLLHFGTAENAGDAADHADPDGDGHDNLAEFTAGTNPKDPADRFQVLSATRTASAFTIRVTGKAGRIYRLQRREELGGASWQPLADPVGPLAEDGVVDLTDHAAAAPRALYRAVVSKP